MFVRLLRLRRERMRTVSRKPGQLSARDLEALAFIGKGYEVAQYQLHEAVFRGRAPNVVSRFVRRAQRLRLIVAERLHRIGMNRLRLTSSGGALLFANGAPPQDVFVPRQAVALKDIAHTTWINDAHVALRHLHYPPRVIAPAWSVGRALSPQPSAIPDVLAIWNPTRSFAGFLLAVEVDLGGESVRGVFAPKLAHLAHEIEGWSAGARAAILILTKGERRVRLIERELPIVASSRETFVRELPSASGPGMIKALRTLIEPITSFETGRDSNSSPEAAEFSIV